MTVETSYGAQLRDRAPKEVGTQRELAARETLERIRPHLRRVGVTRIADITRLDRLGIQVFNAIAPRSRDEISIYNGKGLTVEAAKASAVMEAVERFAAALPLRPDRIASLDELDRDEVPYVSPASLNIEPSPWCRRDVPFSWVRGHDLIRGEQVLVPVFAAGYFVDPPELPMFRISTTNGIASGNSLEEAICHALCEVIERDAWTMALLVSDRLARVVSTQFAPRLHDLHPHLDLDTLPTPAAALAERFEAAGVRLSLRDVTSTAGIPTVLATSIDLETPGLSVGHNGIGTHPDSEVAIVRAITEVAQSRAVDIGAVREDLVEAGTSVDKWLRHMQRASGYDPSAWPHTLPGALRDADDLPTYRHADLIDDIRIMLDGLVREGVERAVVVDLSPPDVPACVVRVVVPSLESWAIDRSRLGARAATVWRRHASALARELVPELEEGRT